jgi:oligopeptide transport system ATP-binding protein
MASRWRATTLRISAVQADVDAALFAIERLRVDYGATAAVRGASLKVDAGEVVALVGESGSGKTQTLHAALGLLAAPARVSGSARFRGQELIGAPRAALDRLRGDRICLVFQEPMTALDPLTRIGAQIAAPIAAHRGRARPGDLLQEVGVAGGAARASAYPHQLSGGERQRVLIAMALANRPDLLIADEPTTALDATLQKRILDGLEERRRALGLAMILVTHDLRLARRYASRLYVMQAGRIVEEGPTAAVFAAPRDPYTRSLVAAEPARARREAAAPAEEALACRGLTVAYGRQLAVAGVDLALRRGRTLAVVGESGSGKSTLARALLRLQPCEGEIRWMGRPVQRLAGAALRRARAEAQIVFQDPYGSLSPRLTIDEIVSEGLRAQGKPGDAASALEAVGLDPALGSRRPDALSGGQRQRVAIARALALAPAALALDEPTSSLDRTSQRGIVDLLLRLQAERGLAYLFVTHDLGLARALADDVMVMRAGRVVERGVVAEVFAAPAQDYTRELIEAADP